MAYDTYPESAKIKAATIRSGIGLWNSATEIGDLLVVEMKIIAFGGRGMGYRIRIALEVASIGFAALGAAFWFLSAWDDVPLAPGAAFGGTSPIDPFNLALAHSAAMNKWASIMTGLSVLCAAGVTITRMRQL